MDRFRAFFRANRIEAATSAVLAVLAAIGFPLLIGLSPAVGLALYALALGTTLLVYRRISGSPLLSEAHLSTSRLAVSAMVGVIVVGLAIQVVPLGWSQSNPPITGEPEWDSPRTRELTVRACYDCHSNEVHYPWYARIAPISWAVQIHVDDGRRAVNYSEWDRPQDEADESAETVVDGEMPPRYYTLVGHADARLTDGEIQELIDGLEATFGTTERDESRREGDDD